MECACGFDEAIYLVYFLGGGVALWVGDGLGV